MYLSYSLSFLSIAAIATSSPFRIPFDYDGKGNPVVDVIHESAEEGGTRRTEQVRITPDSMSYILNVPESRATFISGGLGSEPELLNITADAWLYRVTQGRSSLGFGFTSSIRQRYYSVDFSRHNQEIILGGSLENFRNNICHSPESMFSVRLNQLLNGFYGRFSDANSSTSQFVLRPESRGPKKMFSVPLSFGQRYEDMMIQLGGAQLVSSRDDDTVSVFQNCTREIVLASMQSLMISFAHDADGLDGYLEFFPDDYISFGENRTCEFLFEKNLNHETSHRVAYYFNPFLFPSNNVRFDGSIHFCEAEGAAESSQVAAASVRIPIYRSGSPPQIDVLFRNPQDGTLVPIPMRLRYLQGSYMSYRHFELLRRRHGFSRISNYTFENYTRILDVPHMSVASGLTSSLGIRPDSQIVGDLGALGKVFSNVSLSDSLVVGGSFVNDFVPYCDAESILTLPTPSTRVSDISVAVSLQTPAQSNDDGSTSTSYLRRILSDLHLSFDPRHYQGKVVLGLPESAIEHILDPFFSAGAVYEESVADGPYFGNLRFSNCTSSILDHLPIIQFNLTRYDVTRITLGQLAIHPSDYIDFVNNEARTCFAKIETYQSPGNFANIAMLNVLAIPDMNLWITPENVTICDAL